MDHSQLTNTILSFQNTSNLMDIKGFLYNNLDKDEHVKLSEASAHLGQNAIIKGNDIELVSLVENNQKVSRAEVIYQLAEKASDVTVLIKDRDGNIVSEIQTSEMNQGKNTFIWNGEIIKNGVRQDTMAKPGQYNYEVQAVDSNNDSIKVITFSGVLNKINQISFDDKNNILFNVGNKTVTQDQIYGYRSGNNFVMQDKINSYDVINQQMAKGKASILADL